MNNHKFTIITLAASSTLFFAGCSDDNSSFESSNSLDDTNQLAPASDVKTEAPDLDSFSLATEKIAIEGLEYEGNTSEISIYVADRNNNPVPNNTAILFETSWGQVDPQCLTTDGVCTVMWTEAGQNQFLPANFKAIVLAYTRGEESFTDLNDNDLYDAGEPFNDISEPYLDLNLNGSRDASTEEFIDSDGDNTFDPADGLFTGTPCIGDSTVCNRVAGYIWDITTVTLSSAAASITKTGALPVAPETTASIIVDITDQYGNPMADGSSVSLISSGGKVEPTSVDLAAGQKLFSIIYTSSATPGSDSLTIEVTSEPSGTVTQNLFTN